MSGSSAPFVPLVEVVRGEVVECVHFGALVLADADGQVRASLGAADVTTYLRSAAKPFQLLPLVERGAAERLELGPRHLAIMAASHSGEPIHTALVAEILARLDLGAADLQCGAHPPYAEAAGRHVGHVRPAFTLEL